MLLTCSPEFKYKKKRKKNSEGEKKIGEGLIRFRNRQCAGTARAPTRKRAATTTISNRPKTKQKQKVFLFHVLPRLLPPSPSRINQREKSKEFSTGNKNLIKKMMPIQKEREVSIYLYLFIDLYKCWSYYRREFSIYVQLRGRIQWKKKTENVWGFFCEIFFGYLYLSISLCIYIYIHICRQVCILSLHIYIYIGRKKVRVRFSEKKTI